MKNKLMLLLFFAVVFYNAQTAPVIQRRCATPAPDQAWDDWFNTRVEEFKRSAGKTQSANYVIPVIFHVIHGGQAVGTFPNLSQAQIVSQIAVLNNDYAGTGYNSNHISNTNFSPSLIANCNITFCLAERNPTGTILSEPGIDRVNYSTKSWSDPASINTLNSFKTFIDNTVKSATIWDASHYLNIWISDMHPSVGLLGYSTFPPSSSLTGIPGPSGTIADDGVWCWSKAVGDIGTLSTSYNKGRTATHEIAHYFGLRHIWGDVNCGTDYCDDTPVQKQENTTCPSFPNVTCGNGSNGDMFMNFMDYCYDACLYMFTNDQRTRMQTALINSPLRKYLIANAQCGPVGIQKNVFTSTSIEMFPNPSKGNFTIDISSAASLGINVTVRNVLGDVVFQTRFENSPSQIQIDLQGKSDGVYFVEVNSGAEKVAKRLIIAR